MTFRRYIIVFLLMAGVASGLSSCSPGDPPSPKVEFATPSATCTTADLWMWADSGMPLPENTHIVGRVTANDLSGNFYQLVVLEDRKGAMAVKVALSGLDGHYPVGCEVAVDASGLIVGLYDGALTLGRSRNTWSDYRVEPIVGRDEIFSKLRVCGTPTPPTVTSATPEELTAQQCGTLVRIEGLRHIEAEAENNYWGVTLYGYEAERYFSTPSGSIVVVTTSTYADFATVTIPRGELAVSGILYSTRHAGEDVWMLKIRDLDDVEQIEP